MTDSSEKRQVSSKDEFIEWVRETHFGYSQSGDNINLNERRVRELFADAMKWRKRPAHETLTSCDASYWLGELLAVAHSDGGHYRLEHGDEKATSDAITHIYTLRQGIEELNAMLRQQPVCEWSPIEDGSTTYNTCKDGEEFHLTEGLELYPFCQWCGRPIEVTSLGK
jgi:hypothetical protein